MSYHEPDPDDPHVLVGVSLPGDEATTREMAEAFADEFAALGLSRDEILALFRAPAYAAPHAAWQHMGDAEIGRIVEESVRCFSGFRVVVRDRIDGRQDEPSVQVPPGGFLKVHRRD